MKKMQYIQPKAETVKISTDNAILQASLLVLDITDGVAAENYDDVVLGAW